MERDAAARQGHAHDVGQALPSGLPRLVAVLVLAGHGALGRTVTLLAGAPCLSVQPGGARTA